MPKIISERLQKAAIVMQALLNAPNNEMKRQRVLQKHWGELDAIDLDRIIKVFIEADLIEARKADSRTTIYKLTQKTLDKYKEIEEENEEAKKEKQARCYTYKHQFTKEESFQD